MDEKNRLQWGLNDLRARMNDVAGEWDGDLPGVAEDRAHAALAVIEGIDDLEKLIKEFNEI